MSKKQSAWEKKNAKLAKKRNEAWQERRRLEQIEEGVLLLSQNVRHGTEQLASTTRQLVSAVTRLRGALCTILNFASDENEREAIRKIRQRAREALAKKEVVS